MNTFAADAPDTQPKTAMVSIKMTDDSGGNVAKQGAIGDADPLVIMVPVTESADPLPCDTPGAISCAELDSLGRCDATDPNPRTLTLSRT